MSVNENRKRGPRPKRHYQDKYDHSALLKKTTSVTTTGTSTSTLSKTAAPAVCVTSTATTTSSTARSTPSLSSTVTPGTENSENYYEKLIGDIGELSLSCKFTEAETSAILKLQTFFNTLQKVPNELVNSDLGNLIIFL